MRFRSTNSGGKKAQRSSGALRQPFTISEKSVINFVNRELTVCFTGHRHIATARLPELTERLDRILQTLFRKGYRYFISGAALGFDTIAAERVLELRKLHPEVQLILAIPCSDQTNGWTQAQCTRYEHLLYEADETHVLSSSYYEGCMLVRNRFMVDRSSLCICFLEHMKGGTVSTVAYALKENLPVLNAAMPDSCTAFIEGK